MCSKYTQGWLELDDSGMMHRMEIFEDIINNPKKTVDEHGLYSYAVCLAIEKV